MRFGKNCTATGKLHEAEPSGLAKVHVSHDDQ